jgi:hypothetical protein
MHLIQVPPDAGSDGKSPLQTLWPQIAPLLERAVEHSDQMTTLEAEATALANKLKQLWIVINDEKQIVAAGVTSLQKFVTGKFIANIELFGGANMKDFFDLRGEFEKWAKEEGCEEIRFFARKGWTKFLDDYRLASYVMAKKL